MSNGWIKLHRKILSNPLHLRPLWFSVWIHLLLMANHERNEFIWNGKKVEVEKGSFITGRIELALNCGCSPSTVERALNYLENEHQIGQQKTTKYRVITILKWEDYQNTDSTLDNKRTTEGQQKDTNKNDKKEENKTTEQSSADSRMVISLFRELNPSYEVLFKRKAQHEASRRMWDKYGYDRLMKIVQFLVARRADKYCPQISTPIQLEEKWGALEKYALGLKRSSEINTNPTWKIWT